MRSLNRGVEEHSKVLAFATDRYYLRWERKEQFQVEYQRLSFGHAKCEILIKIFNCRYQIGS